MTDPLKFYATPGPMTAPGPMVTLLDDLPADVGQLVRVVQGLLIHVFWADRYGLELDEARQSEVQIRPLSAKLERIVELDPRSLTEPRDLDKRLVGNCRDFSLLLAGLLRHQGVPARARCGFGRYFLPDHYEDHWVGEYWNAGQGRWVLVDAQMDALQRGALNLPFDPLDVPRDQFITGGRAWQLCRAGQADAETFGIHDMHGLWFVRGNLVRDVAALNKMELLPWDSWGLVYVEGDDEALSATDLAALDEMAALSGGEAADFAYIQRLYESSDQWRVPPIITTFTPAGPVSVPL
ncbi:MAG: transglutaminase domain-containing protein [Candidatus Promineofilum sp.]|nr:transglutaminase domain-containing protein [Promineifilum sp.]